jgi:hypothetical protein
MKTPFRPVQEPEGLPKKTIPSFYLILGGPTTQNLLSQCARAGPASRQFRRRPKINRTFTPRSILP